MKPDLSFADATRSLDTLDATSLKANLTAHPDEQLFVLCAPATPAEADELNVKQVERVIELLMESFKYVVIDTASGLDENTLAALEYATDLILLSATDVPSVRATLKEIDALRSIGNSHQRWHFVLNRADAHRVDHPRDRESGRHQCRRRDSQLACRAGLAQPGRAGRRDRPPLAGVTRDAPARTALHTARHSANGKAGIFRRR